MESFSDIWPISDVPSDAISIYEGPDVFLSEFAAASHAHQTVFAAFWLQGEILNGGLQQFFSNDAGVLAPEAVLALRTLGLPRLAQKCAEAMTWFGDSYPRDRESREAALSAHAEANPGMDSPFEALDDEMVALIYDESPGLEQAALDFVKAHGS